MSTKPHRSSKRSFADPRRLVYELLLEREDFPSRRFARAADRGGLQGRERALARQILSGVLRRRRTLDALFKPYCKRRQVEPRVLWALRIAVFQRFFLDHVPAYAAYDSTLRAARPRLKKATAFVNAVLRALERDVVEEDLPPHLGKSGPGARDRLRTAEREYHFRRPLFPDPQSDPIAHLGVVESYPDGLLSRWWNAVGEERTIARARLFNRTPPLCLRVNPLRASRAQVREAIAETGMGVHDGPHPQSLLLEGGGGRELSRLPGFAEGWWSVQDLASQEAVLLGGAAPGERILDLCAAPGGKSLASWELSGGEAEVWACDVDHVRLARLSPESARLGHGVRSRVIGSGGDDVPEGEWDLLILDLPCTNTGVLGKRPEARWRFSETSLAEIRVLQRRIAKVARGLLGPRTRVLWSTCSLEPEENLDAVEEFARESGLHLADVRPSEPDETRSGGFAALLVPS